MLKEIHIDNLLSFGPKGVSLALQPLNVLIGPNGSGKSNFLDAIALLQAAPRELAAPVQEGGGVVDWLWKGDERGPEITTARVEVVHFPLKLKSDSESMGIRHIVDFGALNHRFFLEDERIETEKPYAGHDEPYYFYQYRNGNPLLKSALPPGTGGPRPDERIGADEIKPYLSILAQRRGWSLYPEITSIAERYAGIRIYRDWTFGRRAMPRLALKADERNDYLLEDCSNLGLVLNRLRLDVPTKRRLIAAISLLYRGIEDFDVRIIANTVQVFLQERQFSIPATRLSDGTLRFLCLLAVLCDPVPAQLICIEEPELGLHPDVLPSIVDLLKEASQRTQIIVTTHSEIIVDCLTDQPDSVVVVGRDDAGTTMQRLDQADLGEWLKEYRLGQLWSKGEIGGNRW